MNARQRIYIFLSLIFVAVVFIVGCTPMPTANVSLTNNKIKPAQTSSVALPVDRFSSVSLAPTQAERDPLAAVAQFKFGTQVKTVGQAINQVLQDTGFQLVPRQALSKTIRLVLQKLLPITQRELGPFTVRTALQTLIGPRVFDTKVNWVTRQVSFCEKPSVLMPSTPQPNTSTTTVMPSTPLNREPTRWWS